MNVLEISARFPDVTTILYLLHYLILPLKETVILYSVRV